MRTHRKSPTVKGILTLSDEFRAVEENYLRIKENIGKCCQSGKNVRIMGVTKTVPAEKVNFAISLGIDLIGENRVQEYLSKKDSYLPAEDRDANLQDFRVKVRRGRIIDAVRPAGKDDASIAFSPDLLCGDAAIRFHLGKDMLL